MSKDIILDVNDLNKKEKKEKDMTININFNECMFFNSIGAVSGNPKEIRNMMKDILGK